MKKKLPSPIKALIGSAVFIIVMLSIYFITYHSFPDGKFISQVIVPLGAIGVIPLIFRKNIFAVVFLASAAIGFIADSIIGLANQDKPSMMGGMSFVLIIGIGFIVGIIGEIIASERRISRENIRK